MRGLNAVLWRELAGNLRPLTITTYFLAPIFYVVFFTVALSNNVRAVPYQDSLVRYDRFFLPGLIAMQTFMLFALTFSLVRIDRVTKVLTLIVISRVPLEVYFLGKLLISALMSAIKALLVIIAAWALTGQTPPFSAASASWLLVGLALGTLVWHSLGFVASAWVTREDIRDLVFSILTLPITFASSAYYNLSAAPIWVRAVGAVNPLTYTADIMRSAYFPGVGEVPWKQLIYLLVWGALATLLALKSLKKLAAP